MHHVRCTSYNEFQRVKLNPLCPAFQNSSHLHRLNAACRQPGSHCITLKSLTAQPFSLPIAYILSPVQPILASLSLAKSILRGRFPLPPPCLSQPSSLLSRAPPLAR